MLTGRDDELVQLRRRLAEAARGSGAIVVLAAEAGVGKTRLVEEAEQIARSRSMCVLRGGATRADAQTPNGLFTGILRALLEDATPAERESVVELAGRLMVHLWPEVFPGREPPAEDPRTEAHPELRHSLFLSRFMALLEARASRTPILLSLEDLHWSDSASVRALHLLAAGVAAARLLVILTVRPEEAHGAEAHLLPRTLQSMVRLPHVHRLDLRPLDAAHTRALISACFPREGFTGQFLELLYQRCGGVPMQALEYVRFLVERGVIYPVGGLWINRDLAQEDVPPTVREAVNRRLEALTDPERHLLSLGAVQGDTFSGHLVASALSRPATDTLQALADLSRRTRLIEATERGFRFVHPVLADIFRKSLPDKARRQAHLRLAAILEREQPHHVEGLGHHLFEARVYDRALPVLVVGVRRSIAGSAYREARVFLVRARRAIAALGDGVEVALRLEVLLLQGEVDYRLGDWEPALEACRQAETLAGDRHEESGRAVLQIAQIHRRQSQWEAAASHYQRALERFARGDNQALVAKTHIGLGNLCFERSDLGAAQHHLDMALQTARRAADEALLGAIYGNLGVLATVRGQARQAVLHYTEAIKSYTRSHHQYGICQTHHNLGMCYAAQGEYAEALASYRRGEALAAQLGTLDVLAHLKVSAAVAHLRLGDVDAAETSCQQAAHLVDRLRDRLGAAECRKVEGMILRERAQYEAGRARLEQGLHVFGELENDLGVAECELELGLLEGRCGNPDAARTRLTHSVQRFERLGATAEARRGRSLLQELSA